MSPVLLSQWQWQAPLLVHNHTQPVNQATPAALLAGVEATNGLFNNIQNLIIRALLAVQPAMISDKHCFEVCKPSIVQAGPAQDAGNHGYMFSHHNLTCAYSA
jgi:hypothetical protein